MEDKVKFYVGFDNGVSSNGIAVLGTDNTELTAKLPIKKEKSYTKKEKFISRIDVPKLRHVFKEWALPANSTLVLLERPMLNSTRFTASISAARALEATLVVFEEFGYNIRYVDSKEWQSVLLPGIVGSEELKKHSLKVATELFPNLKFKKDGDSILIAAWARLKGL